MRRELIDLPRPKKFLVGFILHPLEHPILVLSASIMADVAEKARFYLERAVPQLREFEEKEIFSRVRPNSTQTTTDEY